MNKCNKNYGEYLVKQGETYHFRMVVPPDLNAKYGKCLTSTLRTSSKCNAKGGLRTKSWTLKGVE